MNKLIIKRFCFKNPTIKEINSISFSKRFTKFALYAFGASYIFYKVFLLKYNDLAFDYKYYIINDYCNSFISKFLSKNLEKQFNIINTKSSDDQLFCESVLFSILSNKDIEKDIKRLYPNILQKMTIKIINTTSFGCLLFQNGDFYISTDLIKSCKYDENKLSVFLYCELCNLLLGNMTLRDIKMIYYEYIITGKQYKKYFLSDRENEEIRLFTNYSFNYKNSLAIMQSKAQRLNKYILFYPENEFINSKTSTNQIIKNALSRALKNKNKEFNIESALSIINDFDKRMEFYDQSYFSLNGSYLEEKFYDKFLNIIEIL